VGSAATSAAIEELTDPMAVPAVKLASRSMVSLPLLRAALVGAMPDTRML